jgi:predicted dehydrogenase
VSDRVAWGVLGTGKIARIVGAAVMASDEAELVAIGSRDAARARELADAFAERAAGAAGGPRAASYDDVIADAEVELVYVATHHPMHRAWAVAAAEAGKHVLCEKPLGVRHADAVEIVDAARRNDVFLQEAFAYRSHPQTDRLRSLLLEGAIGSVRAIDATFGYDAGPEPTNYLLDPALAGGSILDVGCYTTSMAHLIAAAALGVDAVEAADVTGAGILGTGVDRSAGATITFGSGALARVGCSIEANLESVVRIVGSQGRIELPTPWLPGVIGGAGRLVVERWGGDVEHIAIDEERDAYAVEVDAVSRAVREGVRSSAAMSWGDSLANMLTLDRWRAAIGLTYPGE